MTRTRGIPRPSFADINVSTGLAHPLDRSSAIDLLERLRDARIAFDPAHVRAWLVANGWAPCHADAKEAICGDVVAGKRLTVERDRWSDAVVAEWLAAFGCRFAPHQ